VQLPARAGVRDKPVGVFSVRTPPRPNRIAASVVEIVATREDELDVVGLDCLDGTPLLDIKRARFHEGNEIAGGSHSAGLASRPGRAVDWSIADLGRAEAQNTTR